MRLARIGDPGQTVPVVWDGDVWRDLSGLVPDLDARALDADAPEPALPAVAAALAAGTLPVLESGGVRFDSPVARPGKIVCIGLNYRDHAEESGAAIPAEPIVFLKAGDIFAGPYDEVPIPRGSVKTDWEVELGVVIGRTARYLDDDVDPLSYVVGYVVSHDVSEREFQLERGGQWDKGKNCEGFNPLGPWLVTPDEVGDPQGLGLRLWVNGELRQDGGTTSMIFDVAHLIRYVSRFMTLYPGDVINTGTPAGVAMGLPGQPYLRPGDVVELEIDGLGRQRQKFGAA